MTTLAYEAERVGGREVMIEPSSRLSLGKVDTVVFDCDGVLIDARRSYDSVILRTASAMVKGFAGKRLPLEGVGGELILGIRRTGGFNDDWDTTYAITLFSILALERGETGAQRRLADLVKRFSARNHLNGRASVDEYLESEGSDDVRLSALREYIDYQVDPVHTRMTRQFDEMYYGSALFRRTFGVKPIYWRKEGLIERERPIVSTEDLRLLRSLLGGARIAMATGRPFVAVQYTLGRLMRYFDTEASVFIGDRDIDPEMAPRLQEFRKPSGASLVRAYDVLSSRILLYVGDSAEDRLMVEDAGKRRSGVLFAGVYGTAFDEEDQKEYFARTGSDLIARDVGSIPAILARMRI